MQLRLVIVDQFLNTVDQDHHSAPGQRVEQLAKLLADAGCRVPEPLVEPAGLVHRKQLGDVTEEVLHRHDMRLAGAEVDDPIDLHRLAGWLAAFEKVLKEAARHCRFSRAATAGNRHHAHQVAPEVLLKERRFMAPVLEAVRGGGRWPVDALRDGAVSPTGAVGALIVERSLDALVGLSRGPLRVADDLLLFGELALELFDLLLEAGALQRGVGHIQVPLCVVKAILNLP